MDRFDIPRYTRALFKGMHIDLFQNCCAVHVHANNGWIVGAIVVIAAAVIAGPECAVVIKQPCAGPTLAIG